MPFSFAKRQHTKRSSLLERNDGCAHPLQKGKKREPLLRVHGSLESIKELYDLRARKDPPRWFRSGTDKFTTPRTAARNSQFLNRVARDKIGQPVATSKIVPIYNADDANTPRMTPRAKISQNCGNKFLQTSSSQRFIARDRE